MVVVVARSGSGGGDGVSNGNEGEVVVAVEADEAAGKAAALGWDGWLCCLLDCGCLVVMRGVVRM